ncbi:MAG: hypothetical protein ACRCU5_16150 [Rhizobiaceae bacterium]
MPQVQQTGALVSPLAGQLAGQFATSKLVADNDVGSLENVELHMALDAQNLVGSGFEASVRRAAESIGAEFLFNIPAPSNLPFQRAALVCLPDEKRELVLVTLSDDGATMDAQIEVPDTAHLFRLGEAWLAVVNQFQKLS